MLVALIEKVHKNAKETFPQCAKKLKKSARKKWVGARLFQKARNLDFFFFERSKQNWHFFPILEYF